MPQTVIRGTQILNNTVQRQDLDTSTVGQAVVTKIVQGTGITLSSTGADSGTGDVTVTSPDVVSTDAGNIATLGTDNHILVPQSQIWSVRLRSFNALSAGNPTFEVDQRNCGTTLTGTPFGLIIDRWGIDRSSLTAQYSAGQQLGFVAIPGTGYIITRCFFRVAVTTAQTTLAASDQFRIYQFIEGPNWRELSGDVHSVSLLVRSNVANLKFGLHLMDQSQTKTLTKLCTTSPSANTWTLIPLANIPAWPAGNFSSTPGAVGYLMGICLAAGSSMISSANDTWLNVTSGNYGVSGQSNLFSTVGNQFDIAFVQHEPGPLCTTPIDCPFTQNYDDCLRYFQKSYPYGSAPGTVTSANAAQILCLPSQPPYCWIPFKKTMAKAPTAITAWSPTSGSSNAVRNLTNSVDLSATGPMNYGDNGFGGYSVTGPPAVNWIAGFHFSADTGW